MDTTTPTSSSVAGSFWQGMTRPSWFALVLTVLVCSAALVLAARLIDEEFLMRHGNVLRRCQDDSSVSATHSVLKLQREGLMTPRVILVGDSASESMNEAHDQLMGMLGRNARWRLLELTTRHQSFWESAALLDRIPRNARGVIVLDVSPGRFLVASTRIGQLAVQAPFGFRSRALDSEIQRAGYKTHSLHGNYFLDNQSFVVPRIPMAVRNTLIGVPECPDTESTSDNTDQNFATNLAALERLMEHIRRQTFLYCLLVSPADTSHAVVATSLPLHAPSLAKIAEAERVEWTGEWNQADQSKMGAWIDEHAVDRR